MHNYVLKKKEKKRNGSREHRTAANPPQKPTHKSPKRRVCGSATVLHNEKKKDRSSFKQKEGNFKKYSQKI
jgi:hypothetical protein